MSSPLHHPSVKEEHGTATEIKTNPGIERKVDDRVVIPYYGDTAGCLASDAGSTRLKPNRFRCIILRFLILLPIKMHGLHIKRPIAVLVASWSTNALSSLAPVNVPCDLHGK